MFKYFESDAVDLFINYLICSIYNLPSLGKECPKGWYITYGFLNWTVVKSDFLNKKSALDIKCIEGIYNWLLEIYYQAQYVGQTIIANFIF